MGGDSESTTEVHSYYYYKIKLAHTNIISSEPIYLYDAVGQLAYTVPSYCDYVDYGNGVISVPGNNQNLEVESISTASYWVFYSTSDVLIDYDNAEFKIAKTIVINPNQITIWATFQYFTVVTAVKDIASVIDGRWDTQVQTVFYAVPPMGYNYAIIDLGRVYEIQAVDIISGFFRPTDNPNMKFDIDMRITLQSSLNNVDYYEIGDKTHNMKLGGGDSLSLEESELGADFSARYIKIILENVKKVDYSQKKDSNGTVIQTGVWPVAFTEISAYDDIILEGEATLIRTTLLSNNVNIDEGAASGESYTIEVASTAGFASAGVAYIEEDMFIYTGTTASSFTGCSGLDSDHPAGQRVTESVAGDTTLYDVDNLLDKLGDRVYKEVRVNDNSLYTQTEVNRMAKAYLKEFYKDHSKLSVSNIYSPFIQIGQTIRVEDPYNNTYLNYFVESVTDNKGSYELVLARYPA